MCGGDVSYHSTLPMLELQKIVVQEAKQGIRMNEIAQLIDYSYAVCIAVCSYSKVVLLL